MQYIQYFIETLRFNIFYISMHAAQINPFDNCSYKSYKKSKLNQKENDKHGNSK